MSGTLQNDLPIDPIFAAVADIPKLVLVPLPQYLTQACCWNLEYTSNRKVENFQHSILSGLGRLKKSLKDILFTNSLQNM
jgi:hypothetical protein